MTTFPRPNRKVRRARLRGKPRPGHSRASAALPTRRDVPPEQFESAQQEFLAGCTWAVGWAAGFLAPTDTEPVRPAGLLYVAPGDERLDELFAWERRADPDDTQPERLCLRTQWATCQPPDPLPDIARLEVEFYEPQRFVYRLAIHASANMTVLHLAAEGHWTFLAPITEADDAYRERAIPPSAVCVTHAPSPALQALLADQRAQPTPPHTTPSPWPGWGAPN
jgi:hypothetical protein